MTFFESMFSGNDSASYGRFASFIALVCLLLWGSIIIGRTGTLFVIPDTWLLIVFIPFGISKTGETIMALKGCKTTTQPVAPAESEKL